MTTQPTLQTERLLLRPFTLVDAAEVQRMAGDYDVASVTGNIPHPYEDGMAEAWINTQQPNYEAGTQATFAITSRSEGILIGAIGLIVNLQHQRAEMGYWVGKEHWNKGYCTEAASVVVRFGFEQLNLRRIEATHLARNPASGRVMQKIGMRQEGYFRQHIFKWGVFEDLVIYGLLPSDLLQNE